MCDFTLKVSCVYVCIFLVEKSTLLGPVLVLMSPNESLLRSWLGVRMRHELVKVWIRLSTMNGSYCNDLKGLTAQNNVIVGGNGKRGGKNKERHEK